MTTVEYEDFFGLFSTDEKKDDKTSKQNPTNVKKQEKPATDNHQDDPFQLFEKKEDDALSESNEDEMSEEEHNRMKNLIV
ncbi:hypothetical protein RFI_02598 [Reticulomyxa filosa]|uniref:Uncharacterized protein n=1 Tax=Reticulomyxa filosa TaxID=46433 RepID=X6P8H7_RETFI|nr:hypothetical protein RFI_02598 [Reticulomyxa filosa]|eukprot:ETO34496.1 hypothetical protein RFI_02598 [Reticulomyxa filosa]